MKNFVRFSITSVPFNADLLSGILWELPVSGISEEPGYIHLFAEELAGISRADIIALLEKLKKENLIEMYDVSEETFADRNWNEEWEKNICVIKVSDKIVVKPSFKDYEAKEGELVIEIDPKMSFGTGEHASTRLMLKLMEKYARGKRKVLDVGSGTGVLSVCAAKFGAEFVMAIDNNEWCYVNGKENIIRNCVENIVEVLNCEITEVKERGFDLILANINKYVLLNICDEVIEKLAEGGILIISGILNGDKPEVENKYESSGLKIVESLEEEEWSAMAFLKLQRNTSTG